MSHFNNNDLFLEPKTRQYGSHMVMTNVHKPTAHKFINIDTRFSDEYNYLSVANCNITLPERINDVKSMTITSMELPMSFYNISSSLGNNSFQITENGNVHIIIVPDGEYDPTTLVAKLNTLVGAIVGLIGSPFSVSDTIISITSTAPCNFNFAVNDKGGSDKYNVKSKLGWMLGFHKVDYEINNETIAAEFRSDLNGPRYLYLALEEFHNGNKNSFIPSVSSGLVNKNIIARISLDKSKHGFGTILPANKLNGLLLSDIRLYSGKTDIQKLNLQLLNEIGNPISLNGYDYSLCIEVEYE